MFASCETPPPMNGYPGTVALGEYLESWPLHVTLIPPFFEIPDGYRDDFDACIQYVANSTDPLQVAGEEEVMLGSSHNVRARRVGGAGLKRLHLDLLGAVEFAADHRKINRDFTGELYNPHVSFRADKGIAEGEIVQINQILLAAEQDGKKYIAAKYPLAGYDEYHFNEGAAW